MEEGYLTRLSKRPTVQVEDINDEPTIPLEKIDRSRESVNRPPKPFDISHDERRNYVIYVRQSAVTSVCLNSSGEEVNRELRRLSENDMGGAPNTEFILYRFRQPYTDESFESTDDILSSIQD